MNLYFLPFTLSIQELTYLLTPDSLISQAFLRFHLTPMMMMIPPLTKTNQWLRQLPPTTPLKKTSTWTSLLTTKDQ
jgi:hypothetical protein